MGFERATAGYSRPNKVAHDPKRKLGRWIDLYQRPATMWRRMLGAYEARNALVCPFRLSGSRHWSSPSRLLLQACKADSVSASLISRQTCYVACWHQTDLVLEG